MNNLEATNAIESTTQKSEISPPPPLPPLPAPGEPWIIPVGYEGPIPSAPPGIEVIREDMPPGAPDFPAEEPGTGTSSTDSLIGSSNVGAVQDVLRFWNFASESHIFTANEVEI
ncbi:MAG: hypothetical protein QNJ68_17780 [Microcoleaceae cyanobacterium MO_207.B10]|nr:hypothetical protein [Microcoleaceae cyanobacterium MO_207.B10]